MTAMTKICFDSKNTANKYDFILPDQKNVIAFQALNYPTSLHVYNYNKFEKFFTSFEANLNSLRN